MSRMQMIEADSHRTEALTQVLGSVQKRYGRGAVMRLGERAAVEVETSSTGSMKLDEALGCGGFPRGRVIEVYGPESSGKTTLTLHAIAEVQALGGTAAFVDAEHALDTAYAKKLGVDTDALLVAQPDSGEQALEIAESLVRSGAVDILVVDSVAALTPQAEIEGDMGDAHMGLQARLMSQALRKMTAITARTGCIVVFINQVRQKIGVSFGNGEVTTGGNALKFYASLRIDIRRIGAVKEKDVAIGNRTRIRVVKNKLSPPFRTVEVDLMYGRGICRAGELLDYAEAAGVVTKSGSWISLGEDKLGNGRENVRSRLIEDPELMGRLAAAVAAARAPAELAVAK
jgi:recombination protein RecA